MVLALAGADDAKLAPLTTSSVDASSGFLEARLSMKLLVEKRSLTLFPVLRLKRDIFTVTPPNPAFCVSTVDPKVSLEFRVASDPLYPSSSSTSTSSSVRFGISIVSSDSQTLKDFTKARQADGVVKGEILALTPILDVDWLTAAPLEGLDADWLLEVTLPMPPNPAALKRAAEEKARKEEWIR